MTYILQIQINNKIIHFILFQKKNKNGTFSLFVAKQKKNAPATFFTIDSEEISADKKTIRLKSLSQLAILTYSILIFFTSLILT